MIGDSKASEPHEKREHDRIRSQTTQIRLNEAPPMRRYRGMNPFFVRRQRGGLTDVGSSYPGLVGPQGWAVRPLKRHASWVQNVVRQFGPIRRGRRKFEGSAPSTRGSEWTYRWCTSCLAKGIAG